MKNNRNAEMAKAEQLENFGHEHPLLLLSEELNNQSEESFHSCARCGEDASLSSTFPCLGCVECGFYLHKKCAEAPLEINHPFHRTHPFVLLQNSPYPGHCVFCDQICEFFVYHCSCNLDLHIKCALFTYDMAEKNLEELQLHDANDKEGEEDELKEGEENELKCFGCWEQLFDSTYFTFDRGLSMHKSCVELPLKINLMCHRKHPLFLQFNSERLSCKICQNTQRRGLVYFCLTCKFSVHIQCASPSPILEDKSHPHPFTLFWRQSPFICDACATEGNYDAYICSTCNIIVHKKCISFPRIIKSRWDEHYISHSYFIEEEGFSNWDCIICHDEINIEHGSYYCSDCKNVAHVNCATKEEHWYYVVSLENGDGTSDGLALLDDIDPFTVIENNDAGEATKIQHFKHAHYLILTDEVVEYECCDGCILPISGSFYYCSECNFFLHKACAEFPKRKPVWVHDCQIPLVLTSNTLFKCELCKYVSNGFAYNCKECDVNVCLRCATLTPKSTCGGHEHPLLFYYTYKGECCGCGLYMSAAYYCKGCKFALDYKCLMRPDKIKHKCDEHVLQLMYGENNDYSESHYCDICEEGRDPKYLFYHCATCDTSVHVDCILGNDPFIKLGIIYNEGDHAHPLTFVRKIHYYPDCTECDKPCQELALECSEPGCNYIVHWECIKPDEFSE